MTAPNQLYINGEWREASDGARQDIINPANEQVIASVPTATAADVDYALETSQAAFELWRGVDSWTRSKALRQIADNVRDILEEMAVTLTEEQGKPLAEARGELGAAADQFEWYAGEAPRIYGRLIDGKNRDHRYLVMRQPVGPVAAFSPWNFPSLLTARKMAPAIAAGCSVIVKPPEEAPRTALFLARACEDVGLPPGLVNMVTGVPAMISEQLLHSDIIRKASFTGSVPVGRHLMRMCADKLIPISLELGGHSPVLVFDDADIEKAAETCARGKFRNNGQVCICASRFFVQEGVYDEFAGAFARVTRTLKLGDGQEPGIDVGPLTTRRRLEATEKLVADAVARGANVACGGKRPEHLPNGFFYEPTVLTGVEPSMEIMNEEPFCPVAPIAAFSDLDDGLKKANDTVFGLAGYIFTESTHKAFLASEGLDVGMVGVNNLVIATAEIPFGGVKYSGFGREGGVEWAEAYTVAKYVNILL